MNFNVSGNLYLYVPDNLYRDGFESFNRYRYEDEFDFEKILESMDLISMYCRPTKTVRKEILSCRLKSIIQQHFPDKYLSNGELIVAMVNCGYDYKQGNNNSCNCYFNVSKKSVRDLEEKLGIS